ncbi:MAG: anti-sigma factor antagonist, partial [Actinomycetota bacterium]|nr:anti-sigma factor antagonist [Actinomycetota bacterium]
GGAGGAPVEVQARLHGREVVLTVGDHGSWRAPVARAERGHGLRLMRLLMDAVEVSPGPDGTRVELRLALGQPPQEPLRERPAAVAGDPAQLSLEHREGVPVARLRGEVDLPGVPALREALGASVRPGDRGLVLDLTAVEYFDSAGLHLLHDLAAALGARGQRVRAIADPAARVARVLDLVGLSQSIGVDASLAAAVAALAVPAASVTRG